MKKLIVVIALLIMALCLCACDQGNEPTVNTTEPSAEITVPSSSATASDGKVTYTVKVTDEDGMPIANAMIQLCKDACIPGRTDENGTAEFRLPEDSYKVSFLTLPEGYTYAEEETEFYFESGDTELTVQLKRAS